MSLRRARVSYLRSRGQTTDQDLTAPVRAPCDCWLRAADLRPGGRILALDSRGAPAMVREGGRLRPLLRTTEIEDVEAGISVVDISTRRSVYRVRWE